MATVEALLDRLSPDEIEVAARFRYAYLTRTSNDGTSALAREQARDMAERYLESKNGDIDKALEKMKETIRYRKENDVDSLRLTNMASVNTNLYKMLRNKKLYVAGRDHQGRSTYVFVPRRVDNHDLLLTRHAKMWTMEKAIACSKTGCFNAVLDLSGFDCVNEAPPLANIRDLFSMLRNHYVGRVHRIYLVNAPAAARTLWAIFSPFAGSKTKSKLSFVKNKDSVFEAMFEPSQAPSWMMSSGTWDDSFDMDDFLALPYNKLLDD